jgi:Surface-adhesin protein E
MLPGGIRMKRLLLIILLALRSGLAYAEWVEVGSKVGEGPTTYADPDTILNKGDLVKMWELYDSKTVQTQLGDSFLSFKIQSEYDCTEERRRMLVVTSFSGNMASGKMVSNYSEELKWNSVVPGTVGQSLWKFACQQK